MQRPTTNFSLSTMRRTLLAITVALLCAALPSPLHAEFKPEIKYAQVGDVKLAYSTRGEGEFLLTLTTRRDLGRTGRSRRRGGPGKRVEGQEFDVHEQIPRGRHGGEDRIGLSRVLHDEVR